MIPYAVPPNGKSAVGAPRPLAVWNFKDGHTPNLTNSGGANGTCFGPDGLLTRVGTTNLLLHSEDFTNVVWGFSGVDFTTANYGNDPIGGATADRVVTDGFSGDYLYQDYTPGGAIPQVPFTFSCWVRGRTGNARLTINESGGATGARTVADGEAFDLDGGIRRYSVTITPNAADRTTLQVRFQSFSATVVDIDVWGAQLEQDVPSNGQGPYVQTTTAAATGGGLRFDHDPSATITNLCLQSEDMDTASWVKSRMAVVSNSVAAPDGSITADTVARTSTTQFCAIQYEGAATNSSGAYTASVFVKAKTATLYGLRFQNGYPIRVDAVFDLSNGTIHSGPAVDTLTGEAAGIEDVGDGWYRCWVSAVINDPAIGWSLVHGPTHSSLTLPGLWEAALAITPNDAYVWGAQLVRGSTPGPYVQTTTAAVRGGPAPARGLLMEETRTNVCLQSEDFSTTWDTLPVGGPGDGVISTNTSDTTDPVGTNTADKLTAGTAQFGGVIRQTYAYTGATAYTLSVYVKKGNHRYIGLRIDDASVASEYNFFDFDTGTVDNTAVAAAPMTATEIGDGWWRLSQTYTTIASPVQNIIDIAIVNENGLHSITPAGTETVYLWGAQLEVGAAASSYIKTTTAPVQRTTDAITVATSLIPGFVDGGPGTLYGEVAKTDVSVSTSGWPFGFVNVGETNIIHCFVSAADSKPHAKWLNASVPQADITGGFTASDNEVFKIAFAWGTGNDFAVSVEGIAAQTGSSGTTPSSLTTLKIGSGWAGHIEKIAYWPERLSNDVLRGLTK